MFTTLAETVNYSYNYTTTSGGGSSFFSGTLGMIYLLFVLAFAALVIVSMWKIFEKAGEAGWKSIVPVYNLWVLAEIAGKPGWWGLVSLLTFIPIIGYILVLVVEVIIGLELAKAFGKSTGFAVLLILLPMVGFPMLAFSDAKYSGTKFNTTGGSTPAATPPAAS